MQCSPTRYWTPWILRSPLHGWEPYSMGLKVNSSNSLLNNIHWSDNICNDSFVSKFATFHHMEVILRSPAFSSWPRSMFCSLGWLRGGPSTPQLQTSSARNKAQTKSGHAPNIALLRQTLYYYAKHALLGHCTTLHGCAKQCNTIHYCSRSWMISWIYDKKSEMNVVPNIETQSTAG